MATEILEPGIDTAYSDEFDIAEGESVCLFLKPAAGQMSLALGAKLTIQYQTSGGGWASIGEIASSAPAQQLSGVGKFRLRRRATQYAVGADRS